MRALPFALLSLCLCGTAKADRFWLSDPDAKLPDGVAPTIVEGVLLAQSDEGYHVRIVGGEVLLPKSAVKRIDKDTLSIEAIVALEAQAAAAAPAPSPALASAPASAPRRRARPVDATASSATAAPTPAAAPVGSEQPTGYDPILGRNPAGHAAKAAQRNALWQAYLQTRDRRFLVELRRLRRLAEH